MSKQCDVVLYDKQSTPVFRLSETVQVFPAETVLLVLQVKSNLTKRELKSALDNIASVARLARSVEPPEPLLSGFALSSLFAKPLELHYAPGRVVGGIFAYNSPSVETLIDSVWEAIGNAPRDQWPYFVVSLRKGSILYGKKKEGGFDVAYPANADGVVGLDAKVADPLLLLYLLTTTRAQTALVARPDLWLYANLGGGQANLAPDRRLGGDPYPSTTSPSQSSAKSMT